MARHQSDSVLPGRIRRLRQRALRGHQAGLLIVHLPNIRYLTCFTGSIAVLALTRTSLALFTVDMYRAQGAKEARGLTRKITRSPLLDAAHWLAGKGCREILCEAPYFTLAQSSSVESALESVRLVPVTGMVEDVRAVKSHAERKAIRASQQLTAAVFEEVLPLIRPGVAERDLAAEIEFRMKRKGADGPAFDTIVASGPRSVLPHGRAGNRRLRGGELVVFDLGAILNGYCSDMTRTVFLGNPPAPVRRLYRAVREALASAQGAVRAGRRASHVDAAARDLLKRRRLGKHFVHSTGHGLGIEVHEKPSVGPRSDELLRPGMVITLEPGAYVPGVGGVRIEDVVAVRRRDCENMTPVTTEMICL